MVARALSAILLLTTIFASGCIGVDDDHVRLGTLHVGDMFVYEERTGFGTPTQTVTYVVRLLEPRTVDIDGTSVRALVVEETRQTDNDTRVVYHVWQPGEGIQASCQAAQVAMCGDGARWTRAHQGAPYLYGWDLAQATDLGRATPALWTMDGLSFDLSPTRTSIPAGTQMGLDPEAIRPLVDANRQRFMDGFVIGQSGWVEEGWQSAPTEHPISKDPTTYEVRVRLVEHTAGDGAAIDALALDTLPHPMLGPAMRPSAKALPERLDTSLPNLTTTLARLVDRAHTDHAMEAVLTVFLGPGGASSVAGTVDHDVERGGVVFVDPDGAAHRADYEITHRSSGGVTVGPAEFQQTDFEAVDDPRATWNVHAPQASLADAITNMAIAPEDAYSVRLDLAPGPLPASDDNATGRWHLTWLVHTDGPAMGETTYDLSRGVLVGHQVGP